MTDTSRYEPKAHTVFACCVKSRDSSEDNDQESRLVLSLNLETPGGPVITKEVSSNPATEDRSNTGEAILDGIDVQGDNPTDPR